MLLRRPPVLGVTSRLAEVSSEDDVQAGIAPMPLASTFTFESFGTACG